MKRKPLPKSLFLFVAIFSLTAFIFVNVHANLTMSNQTCMQTMMEQPQVHDRDETEDRDVKIPDVTVLSRLLELAQKFLPVAN